MASFIYNLLLLAALQLQQGGKSSHVEGRVLIPDHDSMVSVPNHWVTLHRVGTDEAGPLDSVRTSATGTYRFSYHRFGADDAIYFASSAYGGVAYISKPFLEGTVPREDAEIDVFDTTSHSVSVTVRGRHIVVSTSGAARDSRNITDVFDLSNNGSITRVPASETPSGAVWSALLPSGIHQVRVAESDIPPGAVKFTDDRALVFAPFAPGMKQLAYQYSLRTTQFPITIPIERPTGMLEVLVEDLKANVHGPKLLEVEPVTLQGHRFRRFLAADAPANSVLTIGVPQPDLSVNTWYVAGLTVVIGGVMTGALAKAVRRTHIQ